MGCVAKIELLNKRFTNFKLSCKEVTSSRAIPSILFGPSSLCGRIREKVGPTGARCSVLRSLRYIEVDAWQLALSANEEIPEIQRTPLIFSSPSQ